MVYIMSISNLLTPNNYNVECNSMTLPVRTDFIPTVSTLVNLTGTPVVTGSLVQQIGDIVFYCTVVSGLQQQSPATTSFNISMPIPQDIINGIVDGGSTITNIATQASVSTFNSIVSGTNNTIKVEWLGSILGGGTPNVRATLFFIYFKSG